MPMLSLGVWSPDQPAFNNPGSDTMLNVVPRTINSYGPAPQTAAVTGTLDNRCQGAIYVRDAAGNVHGFAGDAHKLYANNPGSLDWVDISKGGGYTTGADESWHFSLFGERIIATNFADPIQSYVMNVDSAFSDLSADAPVARYVTQVRDFLMVANTSDNVDGPVPQRIWWPAIDDPTSWPAIGSDAAAEVQSDQQDLVGPTGWNQGIVGGLSAADVVIFQESSVYRGVYIGPPAIFSFAVLSGGRGTPAPGSIIKVGEQVFYLTDDGFYVTDGLQSVSIGEGLVDKTFWSMVDQSNLFRITSASDPLNKLIYWAFPGPQSSMGNPNFIIVYNYELKRWSLIQQMTEVMVRALTTGYTLDQLDIFGNLETLPFSLDSRAWTGGRLNLACFDPTHALALFSGAPLAATMETSEANLNDKGLAHINRIWPMVDALPTTTTGNEADLTFALDDGTVITFELDDSEPIEFTTASNVVVTGPPAMVVTIGQRNRLADPVTWRTPSTITSTTGSAGVRSTAMFQRARIEIAANASWQNAQGILLDWRPAGNR